MSLWLFVKSFTCQLQLSIIVGKLHHANSISGEHSGYILQLKGSENFTDFSTEQSQFKKAWFKKESRFKKDCWYNWFFST